MANIVHASENKIAAYFQAHKSELKGDKGNTGDKGDTGATGPKGDKGNPGEGFPQGGTAGQVLAKKSGTDYDTEWKDISISGDYLKSASVENEKLTITKKDDTQVELDVSVKLNASAKGAASGVASLDSNTKVPVSELPVATSSTLGVVKPDGTTITIADGVVSAVGGIEETDVKKIYSSNNLEYLDESGGVYEPATYAWTCTAHGVDFRLTPVTGEYPRWEAYDSSVSANLYLTYITEDSEWQYGLSKNGRDTMVAYGTGSASDATVTLGSITFTRVGQTWQKIKQVSYDGHNHAACDITSGTFADARIASAATWNGKQNALPTSGTATDTYAVNVSGNAATAAKVNNQLTVENNDGTSTDTFDGSMAKKLKAGTNVDITIANNVATISAGPAEYVKYAEVLGTELILQDQDGVNTRVSATTIGGAASSHTHAASDITSGTIADTYIASASTWNGKADKVSNATSGHLAGLDSNGNLTDSGLALSADASGNLVATGFKSSGSYPMKLDDAGLDYASGLLKLGAGTDSEGNTRWTVPYGTGTDQHVIAYQEDIDEGVKYNYSSATALPATAADGYAYRATTALASASSTTITATVPDSDKVSEFIIRFSVGAVETAPTITINPSSGSFTRYSISGDSIGTTAAEYEAMYQILPLGSGTYELIGVTRKLS